jgi:hypothetical protein
MAGYLRLRLSRIQRKCYSLESTLELGRVQKLLAVADSKQCSKKHPGVEWTKLQMH